MNDWPDQFDETVEEPLTGATETESSLPKAQQIVAPSWLHPSSLIFDLLSHVRDLIIPIMIGVFSAASGNITGIIFASVFFVIAILFSVMRYFTLRYKIDDGELIVRQGLIFRSARSVPVGRIQNIDLVQSPLHRLFRVAEVQIETASGTEPEAKLRVLSMKKVEQLRAEIFKRSKVEQPSTTDPASLTGETPGTEISDEQEAEQLLSISLKNLILAGVASNRGLLIVGILIGTMFQFDVEAIDLKRFFFQLFPYFEKLPRDNIVLIGAIGLIGGLVALLLLRLLSIVWYVLKFAGYRLRLFGEDLRISCGLFTKISATVPRKRIQFISIHRPIILRWMNLAAIRIETAGGGAMSMEGQAVSRRWFVPVIGEDQIEALIKNLRPGMVWDESRIDWKPLAARTETRLKRLAVIQSVIISVIGVCISQPWGWVAGVVVLPLFWLWARKKASAMRYSRTDQFMIYRSGVFNKKTSLTFFDKVQTVSCTQSPFDRRWKMATLSIDTAASGPAEHRVVVQYLDEHFANAEFESINQISSCYLPDFG